MLPQQTVNALRRAIVLATVTRRVEKRREINTCQFAPNDPRSGRRVALGPLSAALGAGRKRVVRGKCMYWVASTWRISVPSTCQLCLTRVLCPGCPAAGQRRGEAAVRHGAGMSAIYTINVLSLHTYMAAGKVCRAAAAFVRLSTRRFS